MKTYKSSIPEIGLILNKKADIPKVKIVNPKDAFDYAKNLFNRNTIELFEQMIMIILNRSNNTIGFVQISQGGVAGTIADVKVICHYAIKALGCSVILIHNHPSGNLSASKSDTDLAIKCQRALEICDNKLLDFMIIGGDFENFTSFADEGLLYDSSTNNNS